MKGKFDISGRTSGQTAPLPVNDAVDRFVAGVEPMRTMTVQLPERLIYAFKQAALDRKTTVKALLMDAMEAYLTAMKQ